MEAQMEYLSCRVCLRFAPKEKDKYFSLFEKHNNILISDKIKCVANVEIEQNDGKPDKICPDCILQLETAIIFKQKCEKSDEILKNMHTPSKSKEASTLVLPVKKELEITLEELPIEIEIKCEEDRPKPSHTGGNTPGHPDEARSYTQSKPVVRKRAKVLTCDDCGDTFTSKLKMAFHWKKVHQPSKLVCPTCKRIFKTVSALNTHVQMKIKSCLVCAKVRVEGEGREREFHCLECPFHTKGITHIRIHLLNHTGEKPYNCPSCPRSYATPSGLKRHREYRHEETLKKIFERACHFCGKVIKGEGRYQQHIFTHREKLLPCEVCKKLYQSKASLKLHMFRHSGSKSFSCDLCSLSFYTINEVQCHKNKVHLKKTYNCDLCGYILNYKQSLKEHKAKHTPTNVVCLTCGTFVENAEKLILHQKRHTERNFCCPHCDLRFYKKVSIGKHINKKHKDIISLKQEPGKC